MSKIVLKKRVSFDFLGDEYKDAYIVFRRISVAEFDKVNEEIDKLTTEDGNPIKFILNLLKTYFIEGKFPIDGVLEDIEVEDIEGLDGDSTLTCFRIYTGQETDPKVDSPSQNQSTTEDSTSK